MNKRLSYALVLALVGSTTIAACSDDDSTGTGGDGGNAGEPTSSAGTKTGGSSSAGTSSQAGTDAGGAAGTGTAGAGTAGAADGGVGGVGEGGQNNAAGGAAAGAGGAGELVYACGSDTQYKKVCSAKVAANCTDPTDCSDCLTQVSDDYEGALTGCAACDAFVLDYYQCGVDAFESGDATNGMQCIDGVGADFSDSCFEGVFMNKYLPCSSYLDDHACPATWPPQ